LFADMTKLRSKAEDGTSFLCVFIFHSL